MVPHFSLGCALSGTKAQKPSGKAKHSQGKISYKILDTLQEKEEFTCKILAPCKFLTRFLPLAKNCARNVKFLAQFLQIFQVSCKKRDILSACSVHRTCKYLQDIFPGFVHPYYLHNSQASYKIPPLINCNPNIYQSSHFMGEIKTSLKFC